jgi:hypothetical protein
MSDEDEGAHALTKKITLSVVYTLTGRVNKQAGIYELSLISTVNRQLEQGDSDVMPSSVYGGIGIPLTVVGDKESLAEWAGKAIQTLKLAAANVIHQESHLTLQDAGNYWLDELGLDPAPLPRRDLVENHLIFTRARVGGFMDARGRGSKWKREELEMAITNALATVKKRDRTYAGVAKELRQTHPKKAPPSVAALKQLVSRHGIDWKGLKSNATPGIVILWQK